MFKRKFKVRVRHYVNTSYVVEWAYYYLIPSWYMLSWWYSISLTHNGRWVAKCLKYEDAIVLAKTIKTIEDVHKYYEKDNELEREFYERKKEYLRNNAPRKTQYFN